MNCIWLKVLLFSSYLKIPRCSFTMWNIHVIKLTAGQASTLKPHQHVSMALQWQLFTSGQSNLSYLGNPLIYLPPSRLSVSCILHSSCRLILLPWSWEKAALVASAGGHFSHRRLKLFNVINIIRPVITTKLLVVSCVDAPLDILWRCSPLIHQLQTLEVLYQSEVWSVSGTVHASLPATYLDKALDVTHCWSLGSGCFLGGSWVTVNSATFLSVKPIKYLKSKKFCLLTLIKLCYFTGWGCQN